MYTIDKSLSQQRFNNAAKSYDAFADIQNQVLIALMDQCRSDIEGSQLILDLGSGTGNGTSMLAEKFSRARVLQLDFAIEMLKQSRLKNTKTHINDYICADIDKLPLSNGCFDMVFSSLTMQWCVDLHQLLSDLKAALKPSGEFVFSSVAKGSLNELQDSWLSVDNDEHVNHFHHPDTLQHYLGEAGFEQIELKTRTMTCFYPDTMTLLHALKGLGVTNSLSGQRKSLTGKNRFQSFIKHLAGKKQSEGIPLTYKVILASARSHAGDVEKSI